MASSVAISYKGLQNFLNRTARIHEIATKTEGGVFAFQGGLERGELLGMALFVVTTQRLLIHAAVQMVDDPDGLDTMERDGEVDVFEEHGTPAGILGLRDAEGCAGEGHEVVVVEDIFFVTEEVGEMGREAGIDTGEYQSVCALLIWYTLSPCLHLLGGNIPVK